MDSEIFCPLKAGRLLLYELGTHWDAVNKYYTVSLVARHDGVVVLPVPVLGHGRIYIGSDQLALAVVNMHRIRQQQNE